MTAAYRERVACPHCGHSVSTETPFNAWLRAHPKCGSSAKESALCRFDLDLLLRRYMFTQDGRGDRAVQALMFVEVKSHAAKLNEQQRDTLKLLSQVMRNRKMNVNRDKRGAHALDHAPPTKAWSERNKKWVRLRLFGGHLLTLSGATPVDSEWMEWDWKRISTNQLVGLLTFNLAPDRLDEMDWRRRTGPSVPSLFRGTI